MIIRYLDPQGKITLQTPNWALVKGFNLSYHTEEL